MRFTFDTLQAGGGAVPDSDRQRQGRARQGDREGPDVAGCRTIAADDICLVDAMDAVADHGWSFWNAMIWATAKRAELENSFREIPDSRPKHS